MTLITFKIYKKIYKEDGKRGIFLNNKGFYGIIKQKKIC